MPSGYEKSPDYGGEPPHEWWSYLIPFLLVLFAAPAVVFLVQGRAKPTCWTLGSDEVAFTEVDGQQRAVLDLQRIPRGACVTIEVPEGH